MKFFSVFLLVSFCILSMGCVAMSKYNELETRYNELKAVNENLEDGNMKLNRENSELRGELGVANAKIKFLEGQIEAIKPFEDISSELRNLLKELAKEGSGVEIIPGGLSLQGDVFFTPGKAELREETKKTLDKIAEILAKDDNNLSIQGHTDSDPIDKSIVFWKTKTNWELSLYRALNVAIYLSEKGIKKERIHVVGWGEFNPRAPNDTKENKKKNRRVEIFIFPKS